MAYAALVVDLTAKLAGLQQGMNQAVTVARDSAKKIESAFSFAGAAKAGAGFFAAQLGLQSVRDTLVKMKELTDEWTRTRVLVENVTKSLGEAERAQRGLYEAAQATRQNYGDLSKSFASFARNSDQLGITSDQAVKLQTTIAQAIALSGARADSAASALVQFGQGIASGVLRGEELNSVLEQTPKLAKAIADGMGVPIGELIRMGKEGELTAEKIIAALQKIAPKMEEEFKKVTPTIADSFTALNNALGNLINRFNEILPIGAALSNMLLGVAAAIDKIVEFSRFDPMVAARNAKSLVDLQIDQAKASLDALTNPDNPQYQENIPAALRANAVAAANLKLKRALEASAVLAQRMAEQGLKPDGTPQTNLAAADQAIADREGKRALEAQKNWATTLLKMNGVSNDFFNQQKTLFDQFWYQFGPPQTWSDDIRKQYNDLYRQLLEKSGFYPKQKKEKQDTDPIGDLVTRVNEKEIDRIDRLRVKMNELLDPYEEFRQKLQDINDLEQAATWNLQDAVKKLPGKNMPVDLTRPRLRNPDGSTSTEETTTVEDSGRFINIPTIVNGIRRSEDEAFALYKAGRNAAVGEYKTLQEAVQAARGRSQALGVFLDLAGQYADARAIIERDGDEAVKKWNRQQLLIAEPLTEVREQLDEYINQIRIEASTLEYTASEREARVKLLDAEKKGLERNSAEWETYRQRIVEALNEKRLAELDQARGASNDSRTADIQLLTDRLQKQLDTVNMFGGDTAPFVKQYLSAVEAILKANDGLKEDVMLLGQAFTTFFEKSVLEGGSWSDAWKGLLKDIAQQVIRVQISLPMQRSINTALQSVSGGNTLWGMFTNLFDTQPKAARASGGLVGAGQSYWVGEQGIPEVFTPNQSGRITPLKDFGTGGVTVNNYVSVTGEVSRADIYNAVAASEARTKASILDSMDRRGVFARK